MKRRSRWAKVFAGSAAVLQATGLILLVAGLLCLAPLLLLLAVPEEARFASAFFPPAGILIGAGVMMSLPRLRAGVQRLGMPGGVVVVCLAWSIVCAVSAMPVQRLAGLPYLPLLFESVGGWTTTGLSVVDVTAAPRMLLLWRSIMQLAGGAGLAIIMLAATSLPVGAGLYRAEGRSDQLAPHVIQSAKLVVFLYSLYAAVGTGAYVLTGLSVFDAVNHAFAAVSTGGFGTYPESIGHWDSAAVEAVTIVLMILGNLNFLTAYVLFRGHVRRFFRNGEVKVMAAVLPPAVLVLLLAVTAGAYPTLAKGVRVAVFEAVSALTTTGFSTVGYSTWPVLGTLILIVLMLIGGGTCSTAGGIKQYRVYVLARAVVREVRLMARPRGTMAVLKSSQGEQDVFIDDAQIRQIGVFVFLYLATFFAGTVVLVAHGIDLKAAMFEFASALGTVGLSIGVTSPALPALVFVVQIAGMLLGRLEFFVVFAGIGRLLQAARIVLRG